jgi:hypothetical protein
MVIGNYTPDDLIAGDFPIVKETFIVPSGTAAFNRGAVLDADGVPIEDAADADCIALQNVDASTTAKPCIVALTGQFNQNQISTGDLALADVKTALRAKSIFLGKGL